MSARLSAWAERRPEASEHDRAVYADMLAEHLPKPSAVVRISDEDMAAIKAAHIRRFDEDLPRTETLMAVAMIGYRMALRDSGSRPSGLRPERAQRGARQSGPNEDSGIAQTGPSNA